MRTIVFALLCAALLAFAAGCNDTPSEANADLTQLPTAQAAGQNADPGAASDTGPSDTAPADMTTFTAREAGRDVVLVGYTRARTSLGLVAEETGRCISIRADVGDHIGEDGVFAELDPTFLDLDIAANQADRARLASELEYYKKELERYQTLVQGESAAQSTLDEVARNMETARQQLAAARVQGQVLAERRARLTLRAPAGWLVTERNIEEGEWVTQGTLAAKVGRYDELLVPFALSVEELQALQDAEQVELALPELGAVVPARVENVSPGFDPDTRKIGVELVIDHGSFDFRGGLRAELGLELTDPGGSVLVPADALLRAYEEYYLVRPDGVRVKVMLLGSGPEGTRRVTSDEVAPGDEFLAHPQGG